MDLSKVVEQVQQVQADLARMTVEGSAGGAVTVWMNGRQELLKVQVFDAAYGLDKEALAACITEAFNQALDKSRHKVREEVTKYTGGLDLSSLPNLAKLF